MPAMIPGARELTAEMVEVVVHGMAARHPHVHLHLVLDLSRRLQRAELEHAVEGLVQAFPVLGCRYQPHWWRDRWLPWRGSAADLVQVQPVRDPHEALREHTRRGFDHLREPPLRLAFFQHGEGGRLVLSLHHMVADGGGTKAAGAVLVSLLCGQNPEPPPSSERRLMSVARALRLRDLPELLRQLLRESLLPLSSLRVGRLVHSQPRLDGPPDPQWASVRVTGAAARAFVARSKRLGATINDALVATMARLAARRSRAGSVMVAYTVDLRRFLPRERAMVTNLAGVSMVVLDRSQTDSTEGAVQAVASAIGEQKRRLPGLGYALLPGFTVGWWPHSLLRRAGQLIIGTVLARFDRALVVTNIGPLDELAAPFGDEVHDASIVGPFVHRAPVPIATATGFRGALTLQLGSTGTLDAETIREYADELHAALHELAE